MPKIQITGKRLQINKANSTMVIAIAVAAFMVTFSVIASRALLGQRAYQSRVIKDKEIAVRQLNENVQNVQQLAITYREFVETPDNVLGGNPRGEGDRDGDNAKIVLDALPSKYDFPALATSLEKIINGQNFRIESISGTDDEIAQQQNVGSADPEPIEIPFEVTVQAGSYESIRGLFDIFERSIRPFKIQTLAIAGGEGDITINITATTYYQPEKTLDIQKKVVQ